MSNSEKDYDLEILQLLDTIDALREQLEAANRLREALSDFLGVGNG